MTSDSIGLSAVIRRLAQNWWVPAIAMLAGILLAAGYLAIVTPKYEATALIGPKTGGLPASQSLPGLAGLGGLASILQGPTDENIGRAEIYWKSSRFAGDLLADEALVKLLLPHRWDPTARRWLPDNSMRARINKLFQPVPTNNRPTVEDVRKALDRQFRSEIRDRTYRVLALAEKPVHARLLLEWAIKETNRTFRADDADSLIELMSFLSERIATAETPREQDLLATSMTFLEQQKLRTEASDLFMFDVIQRPTAGTRPVSPDPLLVLGAGAILPPTLAIAILLMLPTERRRPTADPPT